MNNHESINLANYLLEITQMILYQNQHLIKDSFDYFSSRRSHSLECVWINDEGPLEPVKLPKDWVIRRFDSARVLQRLKRCTISFTNSGSVSCCSHRSTFDRRNVIHRAKQRDNRDRSRSWIVEEGSRRLIYWTKMNVNITRRRKFTRKTTATNSLSNTRDKCVPLLRCKLLLLYNLFQ